MTIRELEILVTALEHDLIYQNKSDKKDNPEFIRWRIDTEKLLKEVRIDLWNARAIKQN